MTRRNAKAQLPLLIVLSLARAVAGAAECEGEDVGKAPQVSQKLALLERLLADSEPLRRAEASGDPRALAGIADARQILRDARRALDNDCFTEAARLSSDGLRVATAAFKVAPAPDRQQRENFESALQQATAFMLSLESQPAEVWGISTEDFAGIERQIERAEASASDGAFDEALQLLRPVNDRLQRRLLEILNNKTLYYEKHFPTPADEYAYLREQFTGYQLLLQSGQKTASYSARQRVESLLVDADRQFEVAEQRAAAGQWAEAIAGIGQALASCEQAIRATGYSY